MILMSYVKYWSFDSYLPNGTYIDKRTRKKNPVPILGADGEAAMARLWPFLSAADLRVEI